MTDEKAEAARCPVIFLSSHFLYDFIHLCRLSFLYHAIISKAEPLYMSSSSKTNSNHHHSTTMLDSLFPDKKQQLERSILHVNISPSFILILFNGQKRVEVVRIVRGCSR
ncbi:hypothetical protein AMECASPLE_033108 [Ameca splendens]|uniref:Uncharacterized protein n=1 Tax=Ameca splendens TaxID=208324 RepID=A0ABV0YHZ2_9TELE